MLNRSWKFSYKNDTLGVAGEIVEKVLKKFHAEGCHGVEKWGEE